MISNKKLDKMISKCKTSGELKNLISLFANEIIGVISDKQTLKILKAKRIYILGMRSSFTISQYLGFYLGIILDSVHIIRMDMGDAFEQVVKINEDDVLIAISFPRYSKKSYQIVSYAKEKGAHDALPFSFFLLFFTP